RCSPPLFFPLHSPPPSAHYTLSLHDALPISLAVHDELGQRTPVGDHDRQLARHRLGHGEPEPLHRGRKEEEVGEVVVLDLRALRSEEHTSELQSPDHLVCRLLLEKKKINSTD